MTSRIKTQRIKANKSYQVNEMALMAGVSEQTVRSWLKAGMQKVDDTRPTLIMGFQALEFLDARKKDKKRPMQPGQFYCFRCRVPKCALGAMADYEPTSDTGGRLKALCEACEGAVNVNISASDLPDIRKVLEVEIRHMT